MDTPRKSFNDCDLAYLEKTFGLEEIDHSPVMTDWLTLANTFSPSDFENEDLLLCQELLKENILHWNEQELSLHFIGPMFSLIRFTNRKQRFNLFAQRLIAAHTKTKSGDIIELFGKPDGLLATGFREPEMPYFAFQEYKREVDPNGDPTGQALAAMLVGQSLNEDASKPIYGCYVNGRDWYFMILNENHFCISVGYDATTPQIYDIFKILKALKELISIRTA